MQSKVGADLILIMDIGKIFEGLNEDYKDIILAIVIGFPIAYTDCWKLQPAFQTYDLMHQIFLALSISELFVALGIAYCVLAYSLTEKLQNTTLKIRYHMPMLLMLFIFLSLAIICGQVKTMDTARMYYTASFIVALAFYYIIYKINDRKGK